MKKTAALEARLIRSMEQAVRIAEGDLAPTRAYDLFLTAKTVEVPPAPAYNADQVIAIRNRLELSQSVFAQALNVSVGTVRSWEQGEKPPQGPSRRLLEIAARSPHVILVGILARNGDDDRRDAPAGRSQV